MYEGFSREERLIGKENVEKLNKSKVAVFGIGGVGSFVVEGLARAGIGKFLLVDNDTVDITNINRQIHANITTVGKNKVDVMKERILSINPEAEVDVSTEFFMPGSKLVDNSLDYIVDAIDTVTGKIELVCRANELNIPIISAMGTGNKLDPSRFEITDIYKTSVCPLAKVMRKELRKRNVKKLKVIYSKEEPIIPDEYSQSSCKTNCICPPGTKRKCAIRNQVPGSISFVPSVAGLMIAGEIVKDIAKI